MDKHFKNLKELENITKNSKEIDKLEKKLISKFNSNESNLKKLMVEVDQSIDHLHNITVNLSK